MGQIVPFTGQRTQTGNVTPGGFTDKIVSQIVKLCPDVRTALEKGIDYGVLYSQIAQWDLLEQEGFAFLRRRLRTTDAGLYPQMNTLGIIQILKVLQFLCGRAWKPASISFVFPEPGPRVKREYQSYFRVPVDFNQEFNCIIFPASDLDRPIESGDSQLLEIVERHAQSLLVEHNIEADLVEQVRSLIRRRLGTSACSINHIAQLLNVHPKALHRQLKQAGTTFKQLLNDERHELAQFYLANSDIKLSELAEILSYSDASALSRAFKTQCGLAPNVWRVR